MPNQSKRELLRRLDEGLKKTKLSDHAASLKAGLGKDAIRDLRRKGKTMPTIETVAALAEALEMEPEYLAFNRRSGSRPSAGALPIKGEVAAGLWLEIDGVDEPEFEDLAVPFHPNFPQDAQYGLIVRGTSINRVAQPGDVLQCLDQGIAGIEITDDDLVIVERRRAQAGQKEVTAKRFRRRGKVIELAPDSTDKRWAEPIVLDPVKAHDGEEIAIIAVVIGIYKPLKKR